MLPPERGEDCPAIITLLGALISHPIILAQPFTPDLPQDILRVLPRWFPIPEPSPEIRPAADADAHYTPGIVVQCVSRQREARNIGEPVTYGIV